LAEILSERDITILETITQFKLISTKQIEALHFTNSTAINNSRNSRNVLKRLIDAHLVVRLNRRIGGAQAGSASYIYALSPKGLKAISKYPAHVYHREPSLLFLEHTLDIAELYVQLRALEIADKLGIKGIQTEPSCWRLITTGYSQPIVLKPDLYIHLALNYEEYHWFIEIDRSTSHKAAINKKLDIYYQSYRSGNGALEDGIFPRVLWIVLDKARKYWLEKLIEPYNKQAEDLFLVGTNDEVIDILSM
jgi:hypothetical protein